MSTWTAILDQLLTDYTVLDQLAETLHSYMCQEHTNQDTPTPEEHIINTAAVRAILRTLRDKISRDETDLEQQNILLRYLLWLNHGCPIVSLYGDDGEMQCGNCAIDFKRDSAQHIQSAIRKMHRKKFIDNTEEN